VTWLAAISGDVPPGGKSVEDFSDLPAGVADLARRSGVTSLRAVIAPAPEGGREITVFIWSDALFRVRAQLGPRRTDDAIIRADLIVGQPRG
jgi:hypothetical protein